MNSQERMFFQALTRDRAESADMLEKPSMRGIKNSVVEKYSDQAHFIYELLQNADDAHASRARFILETNRLIFAHNGTRHFSVSDPANEDQDAQNRKLGDINAITSIANSNKTDNLAQISSIALHSERAANSQKNICVKESRLLSQEEFGPEAIQTKMERFMCSGP